MVQGTLNRWKVAPPEPWLIRSSFMSKNGTVKCILDYEDRPTLTFIQNDGPGDFGGKDFYNMKPFREGVMLTFPFRPEFIGQGVIGNPKTET